MTEMKQIHALIVMLMMASVAFTGCVSDDEAIEEAIEEVEEETTEEETTEEEEEETTEEEETIDPVGSDSTSTLDTVIARGSLKCGVKDSQYGMGSGIRWNLHRS